MQRSRLQLYIDNGIQRRCIVCPLFLSCGWRQQLIRRKRGKWPIGDARSVDPIRPPVCADRLVFHAVAAVGAASSPFTASFKSNCKEKRQSLRNLSTSIIRNYNRFEPLVNVVVVGLLIVVSQQFPIAREKKSGSLRHRIL